MWRGALTASWMLAAGCYQRNTDVPCTLTCEMDCPAPLVCRSGSCVEAGGPDCLPGDGAVTDSTADAPIDASSTLCTPATVLQSDTAFTTGEWFVPRLALARYAVLFREEAGPIGRIYGSTSDLLVAATFTSVQVLEDGNGFLYRAPRMSPNGREMILRMEGGPTALFGVSTRTINTNTWSQPTQITINSPLLSFDGVDPSPPTTTTPRRMVLSRGVLGFLEVEETTPGVWDVVRVQAASGYDNDEPTPKPVVFLGEAHLTQEGRRLVFHGQIAGNDAAFYLERASVADEFVAPAHELPTIGSVQQPFFASNCSSLFYTRPDGSVYRVNY